MTSETDRAILRNDMARFLLIRKVNMQTILNLTEHALAIIGIGTLLNMWFTKMEAEEKARADRADWLERHLDPSPEYDLEEP